MTTDISTLTIDESKKLLKQAYQDMMTLPCSYETPTKTMNQWIEARRICNEIYRRFGDQVLDWRWLP